MAKGSRNVLKYLISKIELFRCLLVKDDDVMKRDWKYLAIFLNHYSDVRILPKQLQFTFDACQHSYKSYFNSYVNRLNRINRLFTNLPVEKGAFTLDMKINVLVDMISYRDMYTFLLMGIFNG